MFKKVYVTVPPPVFKAVAVIVAEFPEQKDVEVEVMLTVGVLLDEIVKVIVFDVEEPQASVTVKTYPGVLAAVRLVGALAGVAVNAVPLRVHAYVNGATPPVSVTEAEPVAVFPQG